MMLLLLFLLLISVSLGKLRMMLLLNIKVGLVLVHIFMELLNFIIPSRLLISIINRLIILTSSLVKAARHHLSR